MVLLSAFADNSEDGHLDESAIGEGLVGQCAAEKRRMLITDLPQDDVPIRSGLFEAVPRNVIVLPVLFEDRVKAVIELASLQCVHGVAPRVSRAADSQHRHRAEHH